MKIVNIKRYRDRETNEIQEIGTERDVSEERAVEIIEAGYAEEIKNSNDDNAGNPDDNTENPDDSSKPDEKAKNKKSTGANK